MAYGGDATGDRLIEIEGLVGSAFADSLTGDRLTNDLQGGGGEGTDQLRSVETFVFADGAVVAAAMFDGYPAPIVGDHGDNTLTDTSIGDDLRGLGGIDTLSGLDGDDMLDGGSGGDTLDGGSDLDTAAYVSAAAAVSVSLAKAGGQDTGNAGVDTLLSIENLIGSDFDDQLTGDRFRRDADRRVGWRHPVGPRRRGHPRGRRRRRPAARLAWRRSI